MQAYGTQAPATACLQPNMYNHYMYGATHGGRGQQRSSCLSAQNYLNSYSGAMQSHSPYMAATYGYGGVAAAPAGPSHPLTSSSIAQQSSFNSQQSRCSDLQSIVDYSSFPTGYPTTPQSFYYSHTPASTAGGANSFPAAAGSYQSAAAAVVAAAAAGGSMTGSTAGGLVGGATTHCLSAAPVPVSSQTYHLSPLPPISTSDGSEFSESGTFQYHSPTSLTSGRRRRNSNGTSSSRRRRRGDPSPDQEMTNKIDRIFIWDLDETIIVFHSLLTGQYARENDRNPAVCSQIGSALETLVFTIGEELFFLKDLDVESQYPTHVTNIDDLHTEDNNQDLSNYNFLADGLASTLGLPVAPLGYNLARNNVSADIARKIAFRHRRVKELYSLYRNCITDLFRNHMHGRHPSFEQSWTKTRQDLESETNGWLTQAISCLKLIQERKQCTNVMVTRNMLMTTFAKTVAFSLADCFEPENIFSAYKVGFESCLNSIRQKYTERYGREVICIVVGKPDKPDSPSIITAARQFGMPYFPINSDKDLHALQFFLQYGYM